MRRFARRGPRGQTLVETALVLPLFVMVLFGIIILGIGVFYQQQVTNAAREAARFASIHSATALRPTVPAHDPDSPPLTYNRYDRPEDGWPYMSAAARQRIFGLDTSAVVVSACWSGYRAEGGTGARDAWVPGTYEIGSTTTTISPDDNVFVQCQIDGEYPTTDPDQIGCTSGMATIDQASAASESPERRTGNTVTAYACYVWNPPLAGFLLIPDQVTLRAVITEPIQRQQ